MDNATMEGLDMQKNSCRMHGGSLRRRVHLLEHRRRTDGRGSCATWVLVYMVTIAAIDSVHVEHTKGGNNPTS